MKLRSRIKKADLKKLEEAAKAVLDLSKEKRTSLCRLRNSLFAIVVCTFAILVCTFAILGELRGISGASCAIFTRSFVGPTRSFVLPTRSFVAPTGSFAPPTHAAAMPTHAFVLPTGSFVRPTRSLVSPTRSCGLATRPFACATTVFASAIDRDGRATSSFVIARRSRGRARQRFEGPTRRFAPMVRATLLAEGGGQPPRMGRGLNGSARGPPRGPRGDGAWHGVRLARGPL